MPMTLPNRSEMGLILVRLLFWLIAFTVLYWEVEFCLWCYERLSASGALRYFGILLKGFLIR